MFKGRHFEQSLILLSVRWYLTYGLSLRHLKEMTAERGISVGHSTIHAGSCTVHPCWRSKRGVTGKWHVDETYIN